MENIIIETNVKTSSTTISNSEWISNSQPGVLIQNGDIIILKNAFIDSQKNVADGITLTTDLTLGFTIGFYDIYDIDNHGDMNLTGFSSSDNDVVYQPFIAKRNNTTPNWQPWTKSFNITVKAGEYTPDAICKIITDHLGNMSPNKDYYWDDTITNPLLLNSYTESDLEWCLYNDNSKRYKYTTPYWQGASQFSLSFDPEKANYQFDSLHTPFLDSQGNIVVSTKRFKPSSGDERNYFLNRQGGIFFQSLTPDSFWIDTLGFGDLALPFSETWTADIDQFNKLTTFTYFPLQAMMPDGRREIKPNDIDPTKSTATVPILGNAIYSHKDVPYYLIEVSSGFHMSYRTTNKNYKAIIGIVSTQYNSGSVITSFSDSGIEYVHNGEAFNLDTFKIRILDPYTKEPVSGLGDRNSIILEIRKNLINDFKN